MKDSLLVVSSLDNSVVALNAAATDSTENWLFSIEGYSTGVLAESDNIVLVALTDPDTWNRVNQGLAAISLYDGIPIWINDFVSFDNDYIVIADELIFLRSQEGLEALSLLDGSTVWQNLDSLKSDPAYHDGFLYYISHQYLVKASSTTGRIVERNWIPGRFISRFGGTIILAENGILLGCAGWLGFFSYSLEPVWMYSQDYSSIPIPFNGNLIGLNSILLDQP